MIEPMRKLGLVCLVVGTIGTSGCFHRHGGHTHFDPIMTAAAVGTGAALFGGVE
jgi:hypothetical protein